MDSSTFDVKDTKHQVSPEFKPDKDDTWTTIPVEGDQWLLVHNSLRQEVDAMKGALAAVASRGQLLPEWTVTSIKSWWGLHDKIRKDHCTSEDERLKPLLVERFKWPQELQEQHTALDKQTETVAALVNGLTSESNNIKDLVDAWTKYESILLAHFQHDEQTIFALRRAYFSQETMTALDREIIYEAPEEAMGALIYWMGEDNFRSQFMKQRGIPFFVWHAAFKGRLASYKKNMVTHVEALTKGVPPAQPKKGFFF